MASHKSEDTFSNECNMDENLGGCRMYKENYPKIDDLVVASVKRINEMGVYMILLEYNNLEGMIPLTEFSRNRHIRPSIKKNLHVGKQVVVSVMRIDVKRGYIDLSKKAVSNEEVPKIEDRFAKAKVVHSIVRNTSDEVGVSMEYIYETLVWPMYDKYLHGYDGFHIAASAPDILFGYGLEPHIVHHLTNQIQRRLSPKALKFRAEVEGSPSSYVE